MFTWKKSKDKCRTPNGRFCEMAAVTPQTILCEIERYYPAGTFVEAATSQSRFDVVCNQRERLQADNLKFEMKR